MPCEEPNMSSRIRFRHLRAYQAVMTTGNVSSAAQKLNLTQPAVSRQLTALEAELGVSLFIRRSGEPLKPTRAGIELFKSIEGTLSGIDEIPSIAQEIISRSRIRLRIAATPPLINSLYLAGALRSFKQEYNNVNIVLEARHRLDIEDWVTRMQVDVALALLPVDNPAITAIPLVDTLAVAVIPKNHSLAKKPNVRFEDLARESIILPSRQPLRTRIDSVRANSYVHLNVDLEASSAITCCKYASEGFGIAICDPFSPTAFTDSNTIAVPLKPNVHLTYGVLVAKNADDNPVVDSLINHLRSMSIESNGDL